VEIPIYFREGRYDYTTPSALVEKYYETLEAQYKEFIWFENTQRIRHNILKVINSKICY